VVVIPKAHVSSFLAPEALDAELLMSMLTAVQHAASAADFADAGFYLRANAGAPGVTPHMHWHLLPGAGAEGGVEDKDGSVIEVVVAHHDRVVVRQGDTFLKIAADPARSASERWAMSLVAGVPVPRVLWQEPGVLALERVRGRPLDDVASSAAWTAAGVAARQIHEAAAPAGMPTVFIARKALSWLDDDQRFLYERGLIEPALFEAHLAIAQQHLVDRDVRPVLLHGDLQAAHVFVHDDTVVAVIDWGDACLGDPMFDLAVLTGKHLHRLDDALVGYGNADVDAVRGWWSLRRLGELRWMVEHGYGIDDELTALRETL
jgi:aminoglycoside phosphotransferase (APT) family kinase protein